MGFYLGRGVTWVVDFTGCGLPGLVCFNDHYFAFSASYLCSGGTWVHVVVGTNLLRLICVLRGLLYFTYVLAVPGYM